MRLKRARTAASTVLAERGFYAALSRANEMNVQSVNRRRG